ncbi:hypothetical protein RJ641_035316, partial [Dillenia turbinata]
IEYFATSALSQRKLQMRMWVLIMLKRDSSDDVLKDAKSFLLGNVYKSVCENDKYALIRKRIGELIDEDVLYACVPFVAGKQQCFAVKAGIDGLLDIAWQSFCDTSEDFNLPNLKIPFNRLGFYFSMPQKDMNGQLPNKFIQLNVRNKSAAAECYIWTGIGLEGQQYFPSEAANMEIVTGPNRDTIFATHMENLSEPAIIYPDVKILGVDVKNNCLDFNFNLSDGPRHVPHYVLLLAGVAGDYLTLQLKQPGKLLKGSQRRYEFNIQFVLGSSYGDKYDGGKLYAVRIHKRIYHVAQRPICLKHSTQDEDSVRQALQDLKENYLKGRI